MGGIVFRIVGQTATRSVAVMGLFVAGWGVGGILASASQVRAATAATATGHPGLEVALPGRCGANTSVAAGLTVDCFFDVVSIGVGPPPAAEVVEPSGRVTACQFELGGNQPTTAPAVAVGSGSTVLVCADVGRDDYTPGLRSIRLALGDGGFVAAAKYAAAPVGHGGALLNLAAGEPVTLTDHPLPIEVFLTDPVPGVFAVIRERGGNDVVAVSPVPVSASQVSAVETSLVTDLDLGLPVGRYRVWPCVGFYAETCVEQSGGQPFQIIDGGLSELLPGHNRPSANRVNVVFVGSGVPDLASVARQVLTWDGPVSTGFDLLYGPMSIEPLASNRDRFNFWFLPEPLASETGLLSDAGELTVLGQLGLSNVQVTALYTEPDGASDARTASFFGRRELSGLDDVGFGGVRVAVDLDQPVTAAPTLAHEWGHGIFDLRDEYYGFDNRPILNQFPNCAPTIETAADWWGDHLGQVDPFVYEVLQARTDAGLPVDTFDQPLPELVRVGIIAGGCYGPLGGIDSYRPSADSLMNSELPVFGTVNRARVEEILATFTGRGEIEDPDDLVLSCTSRQSWLTCEGQLRSYLDPPASGIRVGTVGCTFGTGDGESAAPVGVSCSGPAPPGQYVTVSIGLERDRVEVVGLDPPESTASVDQVEPAASVVGPGSPGRPGSSAQLGSAGRRDSMAGFWLTLIGTFATAGALLTGAKRLGESRSPKRWIRLESSSEK